MEHFEESSTLFQPLFFKYSQCTQKQLGSLRYSDILHWHTWCNYSIKFDDKLHGHRHHVSPELWCFFKNNVAAQPDGSYLQLLNYCMQKLLQFLTYSPTRESLFFRVQILFSYYFSMNGFCDINIKSHESNLCATLNYPNYINRNTYITTCSGRLHGLYLWFTYSMEYSPSWEASRFSSSKDILCTLWTLNICYRIHKCLPAQSSPYPTYYFLKIYLSTIIPLMPVPCKWFLSLRFPH
jgi:hypothetical protein